MERIKGKVSIKEHRGLYLICFESPRDKFPKCICKLAFKEYAEHFVRCWNAFEPDGSHSKLLDALSKIRQIAGTIQGKGTLQAAEIWKIIDETQAKEKK